MRNSTRSWILLSFISVLFVAIGYHWGQREGLLWGFAIALILNTVVYFYGDVFIQRQFSSYRVEGYDPYGLIKILRRLTKTAGMPNPQVRIIPSASMVAFSVGRNAKNSCIFVSQGLVDRLDERELEAVIAYELASIKTFNTLASTIASGLMSGILILPSLIDKGLSWAVGKKWEFQRSGQLTIWLFVPICLFVLKLCVKDTTPNEIDELASEWIGSKERLAKTLWKLDSYAQTLPYRVPAPLAHLFMVNPLTNRGWTRYFASQMSTRHRIKKLLGYYPL